MSAAAYAITNQFCRSIRTAGGCIRALLLAHLDLTMTTSPCYLPLTTYRRFLTPYLVRYYSLGLVVMLAMQAA